MALKVAKKTTVCYYCLCVCYINNAKVYIKSNYNNYNHSYLRTNTLNTKSADGKITFTPGYSPLNSNWSRELTHLG